MKDYDILAIFAYSADYKFPMMCDICGVVEIQHADVDSRGLENRTNGIADEVEYPSC